MKFDSEFERLLNMRKDWSLGTVWMGTRMEYHGITPVAFGTWHDVTHHNIGDGYLMGTGPFLRLRKVWNRRNRADRERCHGRW